MWDTHPIMSSGKVNGGKAGKGRFYQKAGTKDFPGMVDIMKNYIRTRRNFILKSAARDTKHPNQPTITYIGSDGHPVNGLRFRSSAFSDQSGKFAGMKWRMAEVSAPDAPPFDPTQPRPYEINATWESDVLTQFTREVALPSGLAKVGRWYRARVRMLDDTQRWSHWSAPVEFRAGEPDTLESLKAHLVLSELMYNAPEGPDYDYLELHNRSADTTLNLGGMVLTGGVRFTAPAGLTLAPGQHALLIGHDDKAAFRRHYILADETAILGTYGGKLANNGETIRVQAAAEGKILVTFHYSDEDNWPQAADGDGHSLIPTVLDPAKQALGALDSPDSWQLSAAKGGSPGGAEAKPPKDTDRDGMPDAWELAHGLNPNIDDSLADPDQDSASNLHEYFANTDPANPASRLALALALGQAGQLEAVFTLRAGCYYLLESAETITGPWGAMPGDVFFTEKGVETETRRVPVGLPGGRGKRFFRLQVKRLAE
jgi:hypothetical protein